MSGEHGGQQAHRTPRAKHKHSRSAAGPVSDSEGLLAHAGGSQKKGGRRNQQPRDNAPQQAPVAAWQDSDPSQVDGFFDAHGNFVSAFHNQMGQQQAPGMLYMSDGLPSQGATHQKKKGRHNQSQPQNHNQAKSGRPVNGSNTPPRPSSSQEHATSAAVGQSMTPAKAVAYAGPTFHASPAANALPIPKFFSKSVPNDGAQGGLQARLEQEPEKSNSSDKADPPPAVPSVAATADRLPERSNESPLDFLFKADQEQKRKRNSSGIDSTPPASRSSNTGLDSSRANPWQSIYGTGSRNHQRQSSNGSGREMFTMELDGRDASPKSKHFSPPPPLPHIPHRSVSDHTTLPQLSPRNNNNGNVPPALPYPHDAQMGAVNSPHASVPNQQPTMDHSYSPFNRGGPYPTPRSNETTPTHQQGLYPPQNALHYGNRNLSPLFKAAKQDSSRPPSGLRQEVRHGPAQTPMAELPDSSPSRSTNPHRRASTQAEKAALAYLQNHVPNAPVMPAIPLPRAAPSELDGASVAPAPAGVTPLDARPMNTKSIEDDLKRMLKLTGGLK